MTRLGNNPCHGELFSRSILKKEIFSKLETGTFMKVRTEKLSVFGEVQFLFVETVEQHTDSDRIA
jgi:hypothetical protein